MVSVRTREDFKEKKNQALQRKEGATERLWTTSVVAGTTSQKSPTRLARRNL
jgi:hypothetical protein